MVHKVRKKWKGSSAKYLKLVLKCPGRICWMQPGELLSNSNNNNFLKKNLLLLIYKNNIFSKSVSFMKARLNDKTHPSGFTKHSHCMQQPHMLHWILPRVWKLGSQGVLGTWEQRGLQGLLPAGVPAFASAEPATTTHAISIHYMAVFL